MNGSESRKTATAKLADFLSSWFGRPSLAILALLSAFMCAGGCADTLYPGAGELHGKKVFFPHTDAYEKEVAQLKISPAQAHDVALTVATPVAGEPLVLIDHTYVFSGAEKISGSLNGVFVNGDSGFAREAKSEYKLAGQHFVLRP